MKTKSQSIDACELRRGAEHTFERALSGTRDDDVEIPQVVLVRSRIDTRRWIGDKPLGLLRDWIGRSMHSVIAQGRKGDRGGGSASVHLYKSQKLLKTPLLTLMMRFGSDMATGLLKEECGFS